MAIKWGRFLTCPLTPSLASWERAGVSVFALALAGALALPLQAQTTEPAIFIPDVAATPIEGIAHATAEEPTAEAPAVQDPVAATALRWKSSRRAGGNWQTSPANATSAVQPIQEPSTQPIGSGVSRPGWNITRVDLAVRPAQALQAADGSNPFSDPFGDRGANQQAEALELEPTAAEAGVEELPPPRTAVAPRTNSSGRSVIQRPRRAVAADEAPSFLEINQPVPRVGDLPTPSMDAENLPGQRSLPCDRIYNDRNCCDIEAGCVQFRNALLSDSIKNISLDITPRFMPDLSVEEDEAERVSRFSAREVRAWKNRRGETIATGRMSNLTNSAVIITDDGGQELARIPWSDLGDDEMCYVNAWWRLPAECSLGGLREAERDWLCSTFHWHASALCHKPLYFEDVQLERYGHTAGPFRQPFISGAHFFLNIAALPYNMGINPPHECQYALGYYRPGSCAPWMIEPIPLSLRGAVSQTAVVLGLIHLIP